MGTYREFHRRSLEDREGFWAEQAELIHWRRPFEQVLDYSRPPFARWFVGGETNLCHNAIDRHLAARAEQQALVWISTEVNETRSCTDRELHAEVNRTAAMMQSLGVKRGDRVIIYMPMVPEAAFAILACARLGAIHSVVFGGFAAASLAARIDDAKPALMITADGGSRMGKHVLYKSLVDESLKAARHPPKKVLIFRRGLDPNMTSVAGRDVDWAAAAKDHAGASVACAWLESNEPSYILYTSGTTGSPKGVQRDVGGHAVALTASMKHLFCGEAGETMFTTSDIGWVVGHSYIIYAPLLSAHPGVEKTPLKMGSPSFPVYGYDVRLLHEQTGKPVADGEKGVVAIAPPLPPGCMSTVWGDDERFVNTYFHDFKGQLVYSTFDWGIRDKDGYYFILGRTDDVINVAGHRLGTREIEEAVNMHPNIAECAVVGVADALKGQMPLAFAVLKDAAKGTSAEEVLQTVDKQLGAIARPKAVHFVTLLPKTRSGKTLRRSIQALAEGRDPGDLTTIEDPNALEQIKKALHR